LTKAENWSRVTPKMPKRLQITLSWRSTLGPPVIGGSAESSFHNPLMKSSRWKKKKGKEKRNPFRPSFTFHWVTHYRQKHIQQQNTPGIASCLFNRLLRNWRARKKMKKKKRKKEKKKLNFSLFLSESRRNVRGNFVGSGSGTPYPRLLMAG